MQAVAACLVTIKTSPCQKALPSTSEHKKE